MRGRVLHLLIHAELLERQHHGQIDAWGILISDSSPQKGAAMSNLAKQGAAEGLVAMLEASFSTALPSQVTKEHFARALLTQFKKIPKLQDCTKDSIGSAVVMAASLGLNLGVNGAGWLIPYGKECVLVIGYLGMVDLCYRSGKVESISADVVFKGDLFEYEQGLTPKLKHIPKLEGDRGKVYAVYACAKIKGGGSVFVVMSKEDVMKVKKASKGAAKSDSPWNGDFESEMWKKTAIRRLTKILPKDTEIARVLEFENQQEQRMKAVDAAVVDPLAEGRHIAPKREKIGEAHTDEPVSDDQKYLLGALEKGFNEEIESALQECGHGDKSILDLMNEHDDEIAMVAAAVREKIG